MARRVQVLPDAVANQIAAGEVVERPASVVKELVENALDAGATRVDIHLERGASHRIRVSDDGTGMGREDALLSLDRHATSKIETAGDLVAVRTFGFRGEALPSIAAVSRVTLESHDGVGDVGTQVWVEGGRITEISDLARRRGTTVEVRNLFYNAPARRKFLKSAGVETRAVSDMVTTLALAHPSVAFALTSDTRVLLDLSGAGDLASRIAAIWGMEEAAKLIPVGASSDGIEVRGLVQRPDAAQPGMRRGYLFVNGRPFKEPALARATDRGYRTTIFPGHRPWFFLYIQVPAGAVDVNVHPSKAEVRFRNMAAVDGLVEAAVRNALTTEESAATFDSQLAPPRLEVREGPPQAEDTVAPGEGQMALFMAGAQEVGPEEGGAAPVPGAEVLRTEVRPRLWQVHLTYILAETREGLLIIDQHSAHERVLYERLMQAFDTGSQDSQRLLFPLTLRLTAPEYRQVEDLRGLLANAGFEVEGFGGDTVIVHAVPNPHPYFDAERCFREMIAELAAGSELTRSARNQHERIAKTFACKGAIKAGQRLSRSEMEELVDRLFATELHHHDVHGRPTIVRLTRLELERKFGR